MPQDRRRQSRKTLCFPEIAASPIPKRIPPILLALDFLCDVLGRMKGHQTKKSALMHKLSIGRNGLELGPVKTFVSPGVKEN